MSDVTKIEQALEKAREEAQAVQKKISHLQRELRLARSTRYIGIYNMDTGAGEVFKVTVEVKKVEHMRITFLLEDDYSGVFVGSPDTVPQKVCVGEMFMYRKIMICVTRNHETAQNCVDTMRNARDLLRDESE